MRSRPVAAASAETAMLPISMLMLVHALTVSRKDLEFIQRLFTSADSVQTLVDVARAACKVAEQAAQGPAGSAKVRPCSCARS